MDSVSTSLSSQFIDCLHLCEEDRQVGRQAGRPSRQTRQAGRAGRQAGTRVKQGVNQAMPVEKRGGRWASPGTGKREREMNFNFCTAKK